MLAIDTVAGHIAVPWLAGDQLEIADMERRIADDPDRLYGGDLFQLTDAEEEVFRIGEPQRCTPGCRNE